MEFKTLTSQLMEIEKRLDDVLEEVEFFELSPIEIDIDLNTEGKSVYEVEDAFSNALSQFRQVVTDLNKEKMISPNYQRGLGIYRILLSLGVGISNFDSNGIDKDSLHSIYKQSVAFLLDLENTTLCLVSDQPDSPQYTLSSINSDRVHKTCTSLLSEINIVIRHIVKLVTIRDSNITDKQIDMTLLPNGD